MRVSGVQLTQTSTEESAQCPPDEAGDVGHT